KKLVQGGKKLANHGEKTVGLYYISGDSTEEPYGASSILGYAVRDSGKTGIEAVMNEVLAGVPGKVILQKDGLGNRYRFPAYPDIQPQSGADVWLTVDLDMQRVAFEELAQCVDAFGADAGSVIIQDCRSGEIRVMCDYPYRDPRRDWGLEPASFRCRAAEESFEPGSVFKPILGLAALDGPQSDRICSQRYDVSSGVIEICGRRIRDVHNCGVQDFAGLLIHSSNVGMSMVSMMVSRRQYYETMRRLGFGRPTGIELPQEDSGYLDLEYRTAPERMSPLRIANNAFGQGLRVTLLQLAACYCAIANDGLLLKPYLVKAVVSAQGQKYENRPLVVRRAVSIQAAQRMKEILARVMTEGTGQQAASPYYEACGKTGTAQKTLPGKGYVQTIATLVGFFPRQNPALLVAVSVDNPKLGRFAGTIVGPTFRRIGERCWLQMTRDEKRNVTEAQYSRIDPKVKRREA
ncbi:MAG: penicillin-binding protein 2, partial [candidate division WOR-3 bacterium]